MGESCAAQITFAALVSGQNTATLMIRSSDPAGPTQVELSGTGAQTPTFTLTVNGATSSTAQINSGTTAAFPLVVTPQGGYSTPVTLSCVPVAPAVNAVCSLSSATMPLVTGAATSSVSIATKSGILSTTLSPFAWLSVSTLLWAWRSRRNQCRPGALNVVVLTAATLGLLNLMGCAGGSGSVGAPYTPAGTYTYQVIARATQGDSISSTVTLTVTVR